jgi:pyruvate,water dikinase
MIFTGMPVPKRRAQPTAEQRNDTSDITGSAGSAGSAGVVEGPARVILEPDDASIEAGEILVCRFTDPSWAALISLADGIVFDLGGPASHGAILARELGVPCVIGTANGTSRIRSGDLLRVDGGEGRVAILSRFLLKSE